MARLGNPQDSLKFVHIAGTNGKGSTVEYVSETLKTAGYRVGQFTSPHILEYADRIRICGINIGYEDIDKYLFLIEKAIAGDIGEIKQYSQFEITFAIAMLYFKEENVDIVCLETGIGGLLDATNVIKMPLCSVITGVDFDHTEILGDTIEKIAFQKAGIIKPNCPCVLGYVNREDLLDKIVNVVKNKAAEQYSHLTICEKPTDLNADYFEYKGEKYKITMPGKNQAHNASAAIEVFEILKKAGWHIPDTAVKKGISDAKVKFRCEFYGGNPCVILDGAHNPGAMRNLFETKYFHSNAEITVFFGVLKSKDYVSMLETVCRSASEVYFVDDFADNAVSGEVLIREGLKIDKHKRFKYVKTEDIAGLITDMSKYGYVHKTALVCGSLYLCSEFVKLNEQYK
jgi:dihydrofolate synthase/folylpolyglutamate synthase